mgnify:FL=1
MLSSTKKKYMFVIYELSNTGNTVRSIDVSKALGVKKASVSLMLPNLVEIKLIERAPDGSILLTKDGALYASELYLKYLTLFQFFREKLKSSAESARADAICCLCSLTDENTKGMTEFILNSESEAQI